MLSEAGYISHFYHHCDQISDRSNLKKGFKDFAHSFRGFSLGCLALCVWAAGNYEGQET
jgi:hypothetical protein